MVDVHTAANEPRNEGRPLAEPVGFFFVFQGTTRLSRSRVRTGALSIVFDGIDGNGRERKEKAYQRCSLSMKSQNSQ